MVKEGKRITTLRINELIVFEKIYAAKTKKVVKSLLPEPYLSHDFFGQAIYLVEPVRQRAAK